MISGSTHNINSGSSGQGDKVDGKNGWVFGITHSIPKYSFGSNCCLYIPLSPIISHYIPLSPIISHYIPLYPIISHYLPLYPIISHYIPVYPIISHYLPLYPIISHYIPVYPIIHIKFPSCYATKKIRSLNFKPLGNDSAYFHPSFW